MERRLGIRLSEVVAQASPASSYWGDTEEDPYELPVRPRVVPPDVGSIAETAFEVEDQTRDRFFQFMRVDDAPVELGARGFHWPVPLR